MSICTAGQAVGGDMLVGRRVGFSGTPSDLLPEELGRCDYETGDDGMMISTVLDEAVASHEFLPVGGVGGVSGMECIRWSGVGLVSE